MSRSKKKKAKKKLALGGKLKKPKYNSGALMEFMNTNAGAIGTGSTLAGSMVGAFANPESVGGGIAGGALKGLGMGAASGNPFIALGGAAIGGIMGGIQAKKLKEQGIVDERNTRAMYERMYAHNAGMGLKHGGMILAKSLNPLAGGGLEPISDDAVVVKANEPKKSDSVELNSAFVDHDEVIDNKNRVFSDDLLAPNGKTIAKEAKKLEKMKREDYEFRYKDSNAHIDNKLDKLFEYQESMKTSNEKGQFKKGGKIIPALYYTPPSNLKKLKKGGRVNGGEYDPTLPYKQKLAPTGQDFMKDALANDPTALSPRMQQMNNWLNTDYSINQLSPEYGAQLPVPGFMKPQPKEFAVQKPKLSSVADIKTPFEYGPSRDELFAGKAPRVKSGERFQPDWEKAMTNVATFGPNLVSAALQKKLKGPMHPMQINPVHLKRMSADAQINEVSRQARNAQSALDTKSASGVGHILSKRFQAENQIKNNVANTNAEIANREAWLNQMGQANNVGNINRFRSDTIDFENLKPQLTSQNVANLSGKILQQGREKNQMELDRERMELIEKQFGDSGVLMRLWQKNPDLRAMIEAEMGKIAVKKGGKLPIAKKKK